MNDVISRQAAIDALGERPMVWCESDYELGARNQYDADVLALETVPFAQPEVTEEAVKEMTLTLNSPITEEQWDAITDVDFDHTDRIWFSTKHGKTVEFMKASQWIPCSERLPEVGKTVLICDIDGNIYVGHKAREHWWSVDDKVKNVTAWMPLPEPWKGDKDETD